MGENGRQVFEMLCSGLGLKTGCHANSVALSSMRDSHINGKPKAVPADWLVVNGIAVPPSYRTKKRRGDINLSQFLCWSQLFAGKSTIAEILHLLARLSLFRFLTATKLVTDFSFDVGQLVAQPFHDSVCKEFLPESVCSAVRKHWQDKGSSVVFHRQVALMLFKLGLLASKESRSTKPKKQDFKRYGEALFRLSDHVDTAPPSSSPTMWEAMPIMSALLWNVRPSHPFPAIVRNRLFWRHVLGKYRLSRQGDNVHIVTDSSLGVEIAVDALCYCAVGFMPHRGPAGHSVLVRPSSVFRNTATPMESIRSTFTFCSLTQEEFCHELLETTQHGWSRDVTLLSRYPFVRRKNTYHVYDSCLLIDFLHTGLYWRIHDELGPKDAEQLERSLGDNFESYVATLFEEILPPSSDLYQQAFRNPLFENSTDEVCDILLRTKDCIFLVESKASFLTPHAKYSFMPEAFWRDVESKFITGTTKSPKGMKQLANSAKRIANGEAVAIPGWKTTPKAVIVPVLVVLEDAICTLGVPGILRDRFRELRADTSHDKSQVLPPVLLGVQDVESLEGCCQKDSLEHVIRDYARGLERNQNVLFGRYVDANYPTLNWRQTKMGRRVEEFDKDMRAFIKGKKNSMSG